MRSLLNVPRVRQFALASQFSWLPGIEQGEEPGRANMLWVSVFDHWLSQEDACRLLENIPPEEALRREQLLKKFCGEMVASTEVLSYVMRGHGKHSPVFRAFSSEEVASSYCRPNGTKTFSYPRRYGFRNGYFRVALPEFGCTFHEYWDGTYHFHGTSAELQDAAREWARRSGVYVLSRPEQKGVL